jgi:ribosome maturation factor RimP
VDVFLKQPFLNRTKITGELVEKNEKSLVLIVDKEKIDIPVENVKKVKLAIRF